MLPYYPLRDDENDSDVSSTPFEFVFCLLVKETKGRSSGQTPFTIKPKQRAQKQQQFLTTQKYFPNEKQTNFCIKQLFSADPTM